MKPPLSEAACGLAALLVGYSASPPIAPPGVQTTSPWLIAGIHGTSYESDHYRLCTTVDDPALIARFIRLMEAAHAQYAQVFGVAPPLRQGRLEIDLLATEHDFRAFTQAVAGPEAAAYERVGSGGYTLGERVVCCYSDEATLFSVAAHEGFHQFAARHCRTRLPPAIEEGLATTFETVQVSDATVRFDRTRNPRRQAAVAKALALNTLIPLDMLVQMHAGDVAGRGVLSETFYGQCWVLAQVLEADNMRDGFDRLLATTRSVSAEPRGTYRPAEVRPLLEYSVAPDWAAFASRYACILAAQTR